MSENDTLKRRDLLKLVAGGALGAAAGLAGCRPTGDTNARTVAADGARAAYDWTLEIRGGYGWLFKSDATVKIMSIKQTSCDWFDHLMVLIVPEAQVVVDADTTYQPEKKDGLLSWSLDGDTRFISGLPTVGLTQGPRTRWGELDDPFGPKDLDRDAAWDDQVWLVERTKARKDAESFAARSLLVPYGRLSVGRPPSDWGRKCVWAFAAGAGGASDVHKKALTDRLVIAGRLDKRIGLQTAGGKIYLQPVRERLSMMVQHALQLETQAFAPTQKLPHLAMLYGFADDTTCEQADIPAIEARPGIPFPGSGPVSPGDLCPPLMLDEKV